VEREDLRSFLAHHRISFRNDPTNRDLRYDRNRVRRLVIPVLAEALNPRVAKHLVAAADRLREDAEWLDAQAGREIGRIVRSGGSGRTLLDASRLSGLPAPLRRRAAWLCLARASADPRRVSSRHVEALLKLATAPSGKSLDLPGGVRAVKRKTTLLLARSHGLDSAE
jgi:tRNA(Ile)-lysidine synthase TilS/MesJ